MNLRFLLIIEDYYQYINDYESMKYADLRSLCKERGIKASGKKIDLIQKLKDADTAQGTA